MRSQDIRPGSLARHLRAAFDRTAGAQNVAKAIELIRYAEVSDLSSARRLALESPQACGRDRLSYNPQPTHALILAALDEWLGTSGAVDLGDVDMYDGPPVEYLNVGDPYKATVVYFRESYRGRHWHVMGWGDALAIAERRGWIAREAS